MTTPDITTIQSTTVLNHDRPRVGDLVKIILGKYDSSPYNNQPGLVIKESPLADSWAGQIHDVLVVVGERTIGFNYHELRVISKAGNSKESGL